MVDPGKAVKTSNVAETPELQQGGRILGAIIFGLAFGFLLQKGGVVKYHILIGQLLLQVSLELSCHIVNTNDQHERLKDAEH